MKFLVLATTLSMSVAFAQTSTFKNVNVDSKSETKEEATTTTTAKAPVVKTEPTEISRGVRVSVKKALGDFKTKVKFEGFGESSTDTIDSKDNLSVNVGYELIKMGDVGVISGLTLRTLKDGEGSENFYTLDGNITYGMNSNVYFLGGLNATYAKLDDIDGFEYKPGIGVGLQAAAGFKVNQNLGFELGYTIISTQGKFETGFGDVEVTTTSRAFELGLVGTF